MADTDTFQAKRLQNIKQNSALFEELGINQKAELLNPTPAQEPPRKKRKAEKTSFAPPPSRSSARLASSSRPIYNEDTLVKRNSLEPPSNPKPRTATKSKAVKSEDTPSIPPSISFTDLEALQASWSSWTPTAPPPTRDDFGTFHFPSHPAFTPNKSPSEVLTEGSFGGSYFRPLYSSTLSLTITDDYLELPTSWISHLNPSLYLTNPVYDPEINKYKVKCGQSIEEWEKAGWINHQFDVRGWFQWYCRFFQGRRCADDERQISRWKGCVGERGRWRRMLLKKYRQEGVREVADDGEEEEEKSVSPVMHQTCHHWAWGVTQDVLDEFWAEGG